MQIIRAGVDSLYLAIKATLPPTILKSLSDAKTKAAQDRRDSPIELGDGTIKVVVSPGGYPGGYAFVFDTGPFGARFACRETSDTLDWNLFVKPHATALLTHGFGPVVRKINETLSILGGKIVETSPNRIDYAMDFRADELDLDIDQFIAHPRSKRKPVWGASDTHGPAAILTGRRLESVTIGTMPGKQVIVYEKTIEARKKHHLYWFCAWNLDVSEHGARVWRVELRLGRQEIKKVRRMRSLDALQAGLRPALINLLQQVRYVADGETDPNISRRRPHSLWRTACDHVEAADLLGGGGDLPPGRLMEITRAMKTETHGMLINTNAAALAATIGLDDSRIEEALPDLIARNLREAIHCDAFRQSLDRSRQRVKVMFGDDP
jgi:hypothetical protein